MTLGIFIGLAIYGAVDFLSELREATARKEPPKPEMPDQRQILSSTLQSRQVVWYLISTSKFQHKVNPN